MITTLSALKARLEIDETDLTDDARLTALIQHCSDRFDKECNRRFERAEGAFFEFPADRDSFIPLRFPVEEITAWHLKSDETTGWVAQETPTYLISAPGEVRCLVSMTYPLGSWNEIARITYTGGYVMPGAEATGAQTALPDGVQQAALEQCVAWWQQRNRKGLATVSGDGGSVAANPMSIVTPKDLLPEVQNLLRKYERWTP